MATVRGQPDQKQGAPISTSAGRATLRRALQIRTTRDETIRRALVRRVFFDLRKTLRERATRQETV